jgi:hypothetical protein
LERLSITFWAYCLTSQFCERSSATREASISKMSVVTEVCTRLVAAGSVGAATGAGAVWRSACLVPPSVQAASRLMALTASNGRKSEEVMLGFLQFLGKRGGGGRAAS